MESEIEVFAYSGQNDMIQTCRHDFIAIGGGGFSFEEDLKEQKQSQEHKGFALALDDDLEVWSYTPCLSEEDAERNEIRLMFAESNTNLLTK